MRQMLILRAPNRDASSGLAQASRSAAVGCMIAGDDGRRRCRGRGQTAGSGCDETRARAGGISVDTEVLSYVQ